MSTQFPERGWNSRGYLPHFDDGPVPQMITFRLEDSFPTSCLLEWEDELVAMEPSLAERERRRRIEEYIDKGLGSAWLARSDVADILQKSLLFFDGDRYKMHAWTVMPNHVHALLTPISDNGISEIAHSWKSFTANRANKLLGRTGPFWQIEYFDRFIRDAHHFAAALEYIENNPVKAGLCQASAEWRFSSGFGK